MHTKPVHVLDGYSKKFVIKSWYLCYSQILLGYLQKYESLCSRSYSYIGDTEFMARQSTFKYSYNMKYIFTIPTFNTLTSL